LLTPAGLHQARQTHRVQKVYGVALPLLISILVELSFLQCHRNDVMSTGKELEALYKKWQHSVLSLSGKEKQKPKLL